MLTALTRAISPAISRCELTHLRRTPIDVDLAREQHAQYEACLRALGCRVESVPAGPDMPDCVFIEDTAVVLEEVAIITRPGAPSRRPETSAVAEALARFRPLRSIVAPATIDGGDVLAIGQTLYVGQSARTNRAGMDQLRTLVRPYGMHVEPIDVRGCLHLKTAATLVAADTVLCNPGWVDPSRFAGMKCVTVAEDEPMAANALRIGERVLISASCPQTQSRLQQVGIHVVPVEAGELARAEGGLTCCSLIFRA